MRPRGARILLRLFAFAVLLSACKKDPPPPSRWDPPTTQATASGPAPVAVSPEAKPGSAFNPFFPADGAEGTSRVFTQEKAGFAEAKVMKNGKEFAVLAISDTISDPEAKKKFVAAPDKLDSYPLVTVGKNQSAVLVKDRYQVKVSSPGLDPAARKEWLARFNMNGIAGL